MCKASVLGGRGLTDLNDALIGISLLCCSSAASGLLEADEDDEELSEDISNDEFSEHSNADKFVDNWNFLSNIKFVVSFG